MPLPFRMDMAFDGGARVEGVPRGFRPLGVEDLRRLEGQAPVGLDLVFDYEQLRIDGRDMPGGSKATMSIVFHERARVYALVPGGWLPLPFAAPARFMVDRNIVISLSKIRNHVVPDAARELQWWTGMFGASTTYNPLPYAFEAGLQRKPSRAEFVAAYEQGRQELLNAIPGCTVIDQDATGFRAAYALLENFDARNEREMRFLQDAAPLVAFRVARPQAGAALRAIFDLADRHRVERTTLVVLAVLSCLYEAPGGTPPSIGRKILMPKLIYSEADAYNALSDLRHVELAAAVHFLLGDESFNFCTADQGLAALWCALGLRGESMAGDTATYAYELSTERLSMAEVASLRAKLAI